MKNTFFFLLGTVFFTGCGNKDKLLLNQVPSTPVVNPATSVLVKNNVLLTARLDSGSIIRGITRNNAFKTTDFFDHFGYTAYPLPAGTTNFDKDTIAFASGDPLSPVLNYSADYGVHWTSFPPLLSPALSSTGYYSTKLIDLNLSGNQTMLMLYLQQPTTGGYTRKLYKVNMATQQGALLCNVQDAYQAVAIKFLDEKTGWVLLSNAGTYLSKTTDGGSTWSTPVLIDTRYDLSALKLSNGILSVYKPMGGACFSSDGGTTWKKAPGNLLFYDVQAVNATILYALTSTGLAKSADGGLNWDIISGYGTAGFSNVLKLYFQDEKKGLAYADQRLFVTLDGGVSWKTLLYPYSYITQ